MQVTWHGYPDTSHGYPNTNGLSTVHYRISDALVDPLEEEATLLTGTGLDTVADVGTDIGKVTGMQQRSEEVCVCVCERESSMYLYILPPYRHRYCTYRLD